MSFSEKSGASTGNTRGKIIAHLRRGLRTVDELAEEVGTSDNSVRAHLTALERDGVIRPEGVRRGGGAGKPAVLYGIHPDIEASFSNAYPPVLNALLDSVFAELSPERSEALLESVGHHLAAQCGGRASGSLQQRVARAVAVLTDLGGDVDVMSEGVHLMIRGFSCPLSVAVIAHPASCHAVTTLVSDVVGERVEQRCEHGSRPKCGFRIG